MKNRGSREPTAGAAHCHEAPMLAQRPIMGHTIGLSRWFGVPFAGGTHRRRAGKGVAPRARRVQSLPNSGTTSSASFSVGSRDRPLLQSLEDAIRLPASAVLIWIFTLLAESA